MLGFHEEPQPGLCSVCSFVRDHPNSADQRLEHLLTLAALGVLLIDLETLGQPRSLHAIAMEVIGWPATEIPIDPRHWYWAATEEPRFMISFDTRVR